MVQFRCADRLKPEDTGGTSTGPSLGGRKARLLQRMQGEGGSRSGQPTQEERTSRGLSTAAARPSVELVEEAPVVKLRQLPSVPDLGNLDEEEAQVRLIQLSIALDIGVFDKGTCRACVNMKRLAMILTHAPGFCSLLINSEPSCTKS